MTKEEKIALKLEKKNRKHEKKKKRALEKALTSGKDAQNKFEYKINYNLKEVIAPEGLNDIYNSALIVIDNGKETFVRTFYVRSMPRMATFAVTFSGLLNFPDSFASIFIDPLRDGRASKSLEKDIVSIDSERIAAEKEGDRNKYRQLTKKLQEAEGWADSVDSGETSLFEIAVVISLYAEDMEELNKKTGDFYAIANDKKFKIVNCYGYQKEAFLANQPTNMLEKYVVKSVADLKKPKGFKWHRINKGALATIFNHLTSEFYHPDGIYLGYNISDYSPIIHNLLDPSHKGYGVVVAGTTGSGKSVLLKILISRWVPYEYRFVCIDSDSKTSRGEYANVAERLGGVHYLISPDSDHIINIFEVDTEIEYNDMTGKEYETLNLSKKISSAVDTILTIMSKGGGHEIFADNILFIENIIYDTIKELYSERKIFNGDVNSLFEQGKDLVVGGRITSGKVKKQLPVLSEFFEKVIVKKSVSNNTEYARAYDSILASLKSYIRHVTICTSCATKYSKEEYELLPELHHGLVTTKKCSCGGAVEDIQGSFPYFDGQSTITIDNDTPVIDIDISQLNDSEKVIAQAIAGSFVTQNFINKNSVVPHKAKPLVVIFDEMHRMLGFERTRKLIIDTYRVARKHFVVPITGTQSIVDYTLYDDESLAIIRNATTQFIFSHKAIDVGALSKTTTLSPSQINATPSLGIGECFIIDEGTVVHGMIDYIQSVEGKFAETDSTKLTKGGEGIAS